MGLVAHGVGVGVVVREGEVDCDGAGVELSELDPMGGMARLGGDGEEVLVSCRVKRGLGSHGGVVVGRSHWNGERLGGQRMRTRQWRQG